MATKRSGSSCCEGELTDSLCRLGEVLLAFSSGVLTMVTFGTPYWLAREPETSNDAEQAAYHLGLWQNCTVVDTKVCIGLPLRGSAVPSKPGTVTAAYLTVCKSFSWVYLGSLNPWLNPPQ